LVVSVAMRGVRDSQGAPTLRANMAEVMALGVLGRSEQRNVPVHAATEGSGGRGRSGSAKRVCEYVATVLVAPVVWLQCIIVVTRHRSQDTGSVVTARHGGSAQRNVRYISEV
jgi:hypothetical protein